MKEKIDRRGSIIIFTAPSGAGKTTIVRHLLAVFPDCLAFSISATTRAKRAHEEEGKDYYFLTREDFKKRIQQDAFAEWEEVYSNQWYGTLKSEVRRLLSQGKTVLFDIDVKGATRLKEIYKEKALAVFVAPPSIEALERRLSNRKTESKASLEKRIRRAVKELEYRSSFDRVLVNDVLQVTYKEAEQIVRTFAACLNDEEE